MDFDGRHSGDEIRIHSSPTTADPTIQADFKYLYDVKDQGERPDRKRCYDFDIRHVRLVTTVERGSGGSLGYNEILVYFGEGPADDPRDYGDFRATCVRAQYVAPSYKYPADGRVKLTEASFQPLGALMKARQDALTDRTKDPCVGAPAMT